MKRISLVILFIVSALTTLLAQQQPTSPPPPPPPQQVQQPQPQQQTSFHDIRRYRIGFQIAPDIEWMKVNTNNISNNATSIGFSFGPTFEYNFAPNYSLFTGFNIANTNTEIIYRQPIKFNSEKDIVYIAGTTASYKIKYFEIPLLIKLKTNEIGYVTYFAQFGLIPAIRIGATGDINDPNGIFNKIDEDMSPNVALGTITFNVGGGASYSLTTTTAAYASLSFNNGFINVLHDPSGYSTKAILNRVALTGGIQF